MLAELSTDISGRRTHKRRKHPRAAVDWPITVITSKATYQGIVVNISRGGALIHLTHSLDLGEHVRLAIEIPECQDAILAKAEIVRVFPLKRGNEQQFSHGIAFKFTEITAENLKFFTGNLASEWKEDISEIDQNPLIKQSQQENVFKNREKHTHYALWFSSFILLISLLYLFFLTATQKEDDKLMTVQLDKRLIIIEEQVDSLNSTKDSLKQLVNKLDNLQVELSVLKENLPAPDTLESMNLKLEQQSDLINQISNLVEANQKPSPVETENDDQSEKAEFYIVQKGDNLYQISLKTGITIRELRILNNIDSDDQIMTGQKLIIEQ
jgi:LysM repeat protein